MVQAVSSAINQFNTWNSFNFFKIFRHGDRNPFEHYKGDPWKDSKYWPEGLGQLTNVSFLKNCLFHCKNVCKKY